MADLAGLPGAELVEPGLADLAAGRLTEAALVVALASTRLRRLGLPVPPEIPDEPELRLYRLLCEEDPDAAYGRYNALVARIVSFARALEREEGAAIRAARR